MSKLRVFLVLLLSILLLGISVIPLQADELDDAIKEHQKLMDQTKQARGELSQLTFTEDKMNKKLKDLKSQISIAQANLNQKESKYNKAQALVVAAQTELDQKLKELEDRRKALGQRVKGIYMDGQIGYLEILFQSSSLGDFVTRIEYLSKLVDNDQQLLEYIQQQKEQISKKTVELKAARDNAAVLQAQAVSAKADLDSKSRQLRVALDQNKREQQEIYDQIEKLKADSDAMGEKIRKLTAARKGGVIGTINTWPLAGYYELSSPFGWRTHPLTHKRSLHTGADIPAPSGTPIHAAGDGVVIYAGWYGAYGNAIVIDHGGGYTTLYGHQSHLAVKVNQQVSANQVIGYVGSTGWSTGPHLHFEVRVGGNPTDPLQFKYFR